jgi:sulfatase maturation enzyme AslB (radical SAM superfamily)
LDGENLTGSFVSQIFNATAPARWVELSWNGGEPNLEAFLMVDNNADVWRSLNGGVNWSFVCR